MLIFFFSIRHAIYIVHSLSTDLCEVDYLLFFIIMNVMGISVVNCIIQLLSVSYHILMKTWLTFIGKLVNLPGNMNASNVIIEYY